MKKRFQILNFGIPSVFLIFLVLCLVTFACLSIVTARVDERLSDKMTERTKHYYAAVSVSEERLFALDDALINNAASSEADYFAAVPTLLTDNSVWNAATHTVVITEPAGDSQAMTTTVTILYPQAGQPYCMSKESQVLVNTADWTPDNTITLLQ